MHKWDKWKVILEGKVGDNNTKEARGYTIVQQRNCYKCGKKEIKKTTEWF